MLSALYFNSSYSLCFVRNNADPFSTLAAYIIPFPICIFHINFFSSFNFVSGFCCQEICHALVSSSFLALGMALMGLCFYSFLGFRVGNLGSKLHLHYPFFQSKKEEYKAFIGFLLLNYITKEHIKSKY